MPEGPEIRQAADEIAAAIVDQRITAMFFAFEHLKPYEAEFIGQSITAVRTRGKAIVTCCSNRLYIYTHNQLYGRWYVRRSQSYPDTKRQLRLGIHTAKKSALLYSASDIEVLQEAELATHPFLSRIELDVLDEAVTIEQIEARFRDKRFYRRQLPILLLDQHFLGGLGNYLRSEILFVARVFPTLRPIDCSATQLQALAQAVISVTQQSYHTKGITNDLEIAMLLKSQGHTRSYYRHYVFNRDNRPCFVCGTAIVKEILAGRRLYYCPYCQARIE